MSLIIKSNVKIYSVDNNGVHSLSSEGHNTLCEPGLSVLAKATAGNQDYKISHVAGIYGAGAYVFDKYSTYANFEAAAAAAGDTIEEVEIRNYSYSNYNPTPGTDNYVDNILGVQGTFTKPAAGTTYKSFGLVSITPGGVKTLVAVYVQDVVMGANKHLSVAWSLNFLVP